METTTEKQGAESKTASGQSSGGGDNTEPAAAALECPKVADGEKSAAGKGKRIGRVSQEYIDMVLHQKATGTGAYKVSRSMELVEKYYRGPYDVRALVLQGEAIMEQRRAGHDAILEQYHRLGYAYCEMEEDNSFLYDEKIFGPNARSRPPPAPPA